LSVLGTAHTTGVGSGLNSLEIGYLNNNARLDIAVVYLLSNTIGIFLGFGNEPFAGVKTRTTGDGSQPHSVAFGDVKKNGRSDIFVANYGTNNVLLLYGYGHGTFRNETSYL
jgi:hypothetical protein